MSDSIEGRDRSAGRGAVDSATREPPLPGIDIRPKPPLGITTESGITLGPASRGTRLFGQLIDASFAALPTVAAGFVARFSGGLAAPIAALGMAWTFFYLFLGDGLHEGQSFAKQMLGVRVVDAATGKPCTFGQSFVRNIFTILGPIDWIFIFGESHQRLGDKVAGTIVVTAD